MQESGPAARALGTVERVRKLAMDNFQLLAMLEVVREWLRADAVDLAEAASQTEAGTAALARMPDAGLHSGADDEAGAWSGAQEEILKVQRKLARLAQLAPLQSQDPAVVNAVIEGLRRLHVANEAARATLQASAPPAAGPGAP